MSFPQIFLNIIGILIIVTRLPGVLFTKEYIKVITSIVEDKKILAVGALIDLVLGLMMIFTYEYFTEGLYIIVPIFGFIIFIVSLNMIWFPEMVYKKIIKPILKLEEDKMRALATLGFLIGVLFVYLGWTY